VNSKATALVGSSITVDAASTANTAGCLFSFCMVFLLYVLINLIVELHIKLIYQLVGGIVILVNRLEI
jgi:hypothetical protein